MFEHAPSNMAEMDTINIQKDIVEMRFSVGARLFDTFQEVVGFYQGKREG